MRAFFIDEKGVRDGIVVTPQPFPHLAVGEGGPNRSLTRVKIVGEVQPKTGERLFRAEVELGDNAPVLVSGDLPAGTPRHEDKTVSNPGHVNINWALVLIDIAGGPGGGTEWTSVHFDMAPCPHIGASLKGECDRCGYPAIDGRHPHDGLVRVYGPFEPNTHVITTIAWGVGGFGRDGDEEVHTVRLLVLRPGATFRVVRRGRIGSSFWQVYLRWDGDKLHFGRRDEVIPVARASGPLPL